MSLISIDKENLLENIEIGKILILDFKINDGFCNKLKI
jgi:hypothetical protein